MTEPAISEERQFPHLTPMQEGFVTNYVANGGKPKRAAIAAGYGEAGAAVAAHRMLRNPRIAQAVLELSALRLAGHAPAAIGAVSSLMRTSKSDYVRLEAAKDILNRVGATAPTRVQVSGAVSIVIDLGEGGG